MKKTGHYSESEAVKPRAPMTYLDAEDRSMRMV